MFCGVLPCTLVIFDLHFLYFLKLKNNFLCFPVIHELDTEKEPFKGYVLKNKVTCN